MGVAVDLVHAPEEVLELVCLLELQDLGLQGGLLLLDDRDHVVVEQEHFRSLDPLHRVQPGEIDPSVFEAEDVADSLACDGELAPEDELLIVQKDCPWDQDIVHVDLALLLLFRDGQILVRGDRGLGVQFLGDIFEPLGLVEIPSPLRLQRDANRIILFNGLV